jgi:hypothetical protein
MDRKETIEQLVKCLGFTPRYLGVPSFAYEWKTTDETYTIDKKGNIRNSMGNIIPLERVVGPQTLQPLVKEPSSEQDGGKRWEIPFPLEGHTGKSLQHMMNMIASKETLIRQAFSLPEPLLDDTFARDLAALQPNSLEDFEEALVGLGAERCKGITFDFRNRTFTLHLVAPPTTQEMVEASIVLTALIDKQAKICTHTSYRTSQTDNPKYAMRTWLIQLGMKGITFKPTRKAILANLTGNSAFRTPSEEVCDTKMREQPNP